MSTAMPPEFTAQQTPGEILEQAGAWLAAELGDEFRWLRGQQTLSRRRGTRTCQIRLQPSKWNRTGIGTWATVRVTVRDTALAAWRRRHPDDTLFGHEADLIWASEFINVDRNLYFLELFGHLPQAVGDVPQVSLVRLLAGARSILLPLLDSFSSPQAATMDLPDSALVLAPSLVEWGDQQR